MNMEEHLRTLGIGHIAYSLLLVIPAVLVFSILTSVGILVDDPEATQILPLIGTFVGAFLLFLAIPGIIAGVGVLKGKSWGLPLALVVGIFNILCFPVGTALGAYTIWVFTKVNEKPAAERTYGYA